ncbi:hypothetical protein ROLI_024280 [Roseobacter fucihabitans]|uniref:DUF2007 domain-containing protein n=1 Tax=Roseobacter fucihabitans TaxID=1537242 RepID=A0ABZ2BTH5_9RHOB|nr:hypothetical protein [Roseobacter litoralis]MBC6965266.1 hypothetical protein [Roseobacter litoralis]
MAKLNRSSLVPIAHAYGAAAHGLAVSQLRAQDIPVFTQSTYFSGLFPQYFVPVGGIAITVPKSHAMDASAVLQSTVWDSRPFSKLKAAMWVVITLAILVPPLPTAVFLRNRRTSGVAMRSIPDDP